MLRQTLVHLKLRIDGLLHTLVVLLIALQLPTAACASTWSPLAPGIEYMDLVSHPFSPWSHVHVFRLNLHHCQLDVVTAQSMHQSSASVLQLAEYSRALIAINGGFFDTNYQPLGLRVGHGHHYASLKPISWWGVFSLANHTARITPFSAFKSDSTIDFAVQSGPRLIINGSIPKLKAGLAERTALGITETGHVIMLITENTLLTTTALAELLKNPPINCVNALNLDGGHSSQLAARFDAKRIHTQRVTPVSDAIVVRLSARNSH